MLNLCVHQLFKRFSRWIYIYSKKFKNSTTFKFFDTFRAHKKGIIKLKMVKYSITQSKGIVTYYIYISEM